MGDEDLLKADYDRWAEIYDSVYSYVVEDIPFYVQEARSSGGRVLELGCGTGRVALPIAQAGVDIVGLDFSTAMLVQARRKISNAERLSGSLVLIEGDMRDFSLKGERGNGEPESEVLGRDEPFSLVIIPFRGFLSLLTVGDQVRCLINIKRHLRPGGKLILSMFVPDPSMLVQEGDVPYHFRDVTDPGTGRQFVLWQQNRYDNYGQIINTRTIIEELDDEGAVRERKYRDFQLRYIHRWEMHHLLRMCGFEVLDLFGDFSRSDFDDTSTEMIWVAVVPQ